MKEFRSALAQYLIGDLEVSDLEDAIGSATHLARAEQTGLFSPACEPDAIGGVSPAEQFQALVIKGFDGESAEAA